MKHIDQGDVERLLPFPALVRTLREAFCADISVPLRQTLKLPDETAPIGTSLLMPAWNRTGYYGVKLVNIFPGNAGLGLPGLHAVYVLFDGHTGVPLATLDGDAITSRRTAAASALGVALLAKPDAHRLLVVGAGRGASPLAPAMCQRARTESGRGMEPPDAGACHSHRADAVLRRSASLRPSW